MVICNYHMSITTHDTIFPCTPTPVAHESWRGYILRLFLYQDSSFFPQAASNCVYTLAHSYTFYELTGSKLAADTMVNHVTSLGLSVLGILWTLGKTKKSIVYNLIHRDLTTVTHNVTRLIEEGYVHEQVISRREKYISLSDRGKELYTQFINKSITLTRELKSLKEDRQLHP